MTTDFDAVVVGAGFGGLSMLQNLRQLDMSVKVFERGDGVGGTWYWNRYPGARCDSESVYYMFSDHFSPQVLDEWTWSERFAGQPEILDYLNFVTDKMDLRRDIQFGTAVTGAVYDEANNRWEITTDDGRTTTARYLVTAAVFPNARPDYDIPARTSRWTSPASASRDRHGATGVQAIRDREQASQLTSSAHAARHRRARGNVDYPELWEKARASGFGLPYQVVEGSAAEAPSEERQQRYQRAWDKGGFYIGLETYSDFLVNKDSNDTISDFIRTKIRETVHDPAIAELLAPSDHPFFTKRPPLETDYYDDLQPRQRHPDRHQPHARSRRSPATGCGRASRSTRSTPSCSPPASTR